MYSKAEINALCSQWGIGLKKRWGQNFLIHRQTAEDVAAQALSLVAGDASPHTVWELGPGFGALTRVFLQQSFIKQLVAFEIDAGLCRALEAVFNSHIAEGRLHIENGDALRTLPAFEARQVPQLICGNLPYSVGVRLLIMLAQMPHLHVPQCVMLQKEAAERIAAHSGSKTYGVSSVILQSVYTVRVERTVARSFFYPYAHVDSALCVLRPNNEAAFTREYMQVLTAIAKAAFSVRRKKLANTLVPYLRGSYGLGEALLESVGIDPSCRAEAISVECYRALAWECMKKKTPSV